MVVEDRVGRGHGTDGALDLGRLDALLRRDGPVAVEAALRAVDGPLAAAAGRAVAGCAHLLGPVEPGPALTDVFLAHLAAVPPLRPLVDAYAATLPPGPRLTSRRLAPRPPALLRTLAPIRYAAALAAGPGGAWLATVGSRRTVEVWDVATGAVRATLTGRAGTVAGIAGLAAAPDGSWLAGQVGDGDEVCVWNLASGSERTVERTVTIRGGGAVSCLAAAPDGTWLATAAGHVVRIWDAATGALRAELAGRTGSPIIRLAVAPDGTWLAVGHVSRAAEVWDAATGEPRLVLPDGTGEGFHVAAGPDGTALLTAGQQGTRIWDAGTGALRGEFPAAYEAALAPDGSWLVTAGEGGCRVWDTESGALRAALPGPWGVGEQVVLSPDGRWLATARLPGHHRRPVRIWDVATLLGSPAADPGDPVRGLVPGAATAPVLLFTGAGDAGPLRVRAADGATRSTVDGVRWPYGAVSPDGTRLALTGTDGTVRIRDLDGGAEPVVLAGAHQPGGGVTFAPDGSWLASWEGWSNRVRLWDAATGAEKLTVSGAGNYVNHVAIAPDGAWLALACSDGRIRTKAADTGRNHRVLRGHHRWVTAVAIAPDGAWLASTGWDRTVRLWDARTGRARAVLTGHEDEVQTVAIAPDGTWLASADDEGAVLVWRAATGELSAAMRVDGPRLTQLRWLADGTGLWAGGYGAAHRLDFTPGR